MRVSRFGLLQFQTRHPGGMRTGLTVDPATSAKTSDAGELVGGAPHMAQTERLTVGQDPAWVDDMAR
jgi:hypothetical protein